MIDPRLRRLPRLGAGAVGPDCAGTRPGRERGCSRSDLCIVLEHVEGGSLSKIVHDVGQGSLPESPELVTIYISSAGCAGCAG